MTRKSINLALQGGGAHGAFTWGVLDRLLEEDRIDIDGITATSAGAMNAAALKAGWVKGGNEGARAQLDQFWNELSAQTAAPNDCVQDWLTAFMPSPQNFARAMQYNPAYLAGDAISRVFSPYELNPLNIQPLRKLVAEMFDFDDVCANKGPKLFISATNVRSGKIKVFTGDQISEDALLASACLPTLYQAVEIVDPATGVLEAYWDGGYMGNPALFPLFYDTTTADVLVVHINPIRREDVPRTAPEIANRINEISFNSSLLRDLRAINFVHRLIENGAVSPGTMKNVLVHSIQDDALMNQLSAVTKLTPDRTLLNRLKSAGRDRMDDFLKNHWDDIGETGTVNLREMFQ